MQREQWLKVSPSSGRLPQFPQAFLSIAIAFRSSKVQVKALLVPAGEIALPEVVGGGWVGAPPVHVHVLVVHVTLLLLLS